MIRPENDRISITLSRKQIRWIEEQSKRLNMTKSKFIKWLLDKNIAKIMSAILKQENNDNLLKIAKVKWIKFDDEED